MRKAEAVLLAKQCKSWTYLAHDEPENANLFVTTGNAVPAWRKCEAVP